MAIACAIHARRRIMRPLGLAALLPAVRDYQAQDARQNGQRSQHEHRNPCRAPLTGGKVGGHCDQQQADD